MEENKILKNASIVVGLIVSLFALYATADKVFLTEEEASNLYATVQQVSELPIIMRIGQAQDELVSLGSEKTFLIRRNEDTQLLEAKIREVESRIGRLKTQLEMGRHKKSG